MSNYVLTCLLKLVDALGLLLFFIIIPYFVASEAWEWKNCPFDNLRKS